MVFETTEKPLLAFFVGEVYGLSFLSFISCTRILKVEEKGERNFKKEEGKREKVIGN